ncbi:lipocalin Can f 6.0101-like [Lemur catta]|uniref:lipocalin Can f 6.0101-like n=1 Tax=Lemur catta TaxID=9447 RepID=UPI001E267577|nr:lipocalin Can f 6.0101-like [Lemur catta]
MSFCEDKLSANGECSEIPLVCDLTGKDGECSVDYDGHNVATILDTDYTDYLIYHVKNSENEEKSQIMELYGREPDVSPELKEKFVEYCEKYGIVKENILDLTKVVLNDCFHTWAPASSLPGPHVLL